MIKKDIIEARKLAGIKFTKKNQIVIPLKDTKGNIHSLQYINEDGSKRFLKGGEKQGKFFMLHEGSLNNSDKTKNIIIAEGFATAASIDKAINAGKTWNQKTPIATCFDAGNIEHALKELKTTNPNKSFTIAADNDMWKDRNTGKEKAQTAAKKYGAKVILPNFNYSHKDHTPTDFNDLHKLAGIDEVRKQFFEEHNYKHYKGEVDLHKNNNINKVNQKQVVNDNAQQTMTHTSTELEHHFELHK